MTSSLNETKNLSTLCTFSAQWSKLVNTSDYSLSKLKNFLSNSILIQASCSSPSVSPMDISTPYHLYLLHTLFLPWTSNPSPLIPAHLNGHLSSSHFASKLHAFSLTCYITAFGIHECMHSYTHVYINVIFDALVRIGPNMLHLLSNEIPHLQT